MIKKYYGIFSDTEKNSICKKINTGDLNLFEYSIWKNGLDGIIATSCFFAPSFIQINKYVFIYDLIRCNDYQSEGFIKDLEKRFISKAAIEKYVNCVCLGDLFINSDQKFMEDTEMLNQFIDCVTYFWRERLSKIFPDKSFIFERGYDMNGDLGLCFTFYELETNTKE